MSFFFESFAFSLSLICSHSFSLSSLSLPPSLRWGYDSVDALRKVVQGYKEARLPLEVVWSDIGELRILREFEFVLSSSFALRLQPLPPSHESGSSQIKNTPPLFFLFFIFRLPRRLPRLHLRPAALPAPRDESIRLPGAPRPRQEMGPDPRPGD